MFQRKYYKRTKSEFLFPTSNITSYKCKVPKVRSDYELWIQSSPAGLQTDYNLKLKYSFRSQWKIKLKLNKYIIKN
jgi:hypothetical protein